MVKMEYVGPGTKPADISVEKLEVKGLEQTGLWRKATSEKKKPEDKKEGS